MATIDAKDIVEKASTILQDTGNIRWTTAEMLDWVNDAQRELALVRPDAFVKNESVQLVAGVKQTIPADGTKLIEVNRNMGTSGTTPGRAIVIVFKHLMDAQDPDWSSAPPKGVVKHFMSDIRDPKTFYVYPPQPPAPEYVELVYSAYPPTVVNLDVGTKISVDDIYRSEAGNAQLALAYRESFVKSLSLKFEIDKMVDPNQRLAS